MQLEINGCRSTHRANPSSSEGSGTSNFKTEGGGRYVPCGRFRLRCTKARLTGKRKEALVAARRVPKKVHHCHSTSQQSYSAENTVPNPPKISQPMDNELESEYVVQDGLLWGPVKERALIDMMKEMVENYQARRKVVWTDTIWRDFASRLSLMFSKTYLFKQVKDKFARMKSDYCVFEKLKGQSGFAVDPIYGCIIAPDDFWDKASAKQLKFRARGLANYDDLKVIFGSTPAIGKLARSSAQGPPTFGGRPSEGGWEGGWEEPFCNPSATSSYPPAAAAAASIGEIQEILRKRHLSSGGDSGKSKKTRTCSADDYLGAFTEASAFALNAKAAYHKSKTVCRDTASSPSRDPFSEDKCQDAIIALQDEITEDQYAVAMEQLSNPTWRRSFLRSPRHLQLAMLWRLF